MRAGDLINRYYRAVHALLDEHYKRPELKGEHPTFFVFAGRRIPKRAREQYRRVTAAWRLFFVKRAALHAALVAAESAMLEGRKP